MGKPVNLGEDPKPIHIFCISPNSLFTPTPLSNKPKWGKNKPTNWMVQKNQKSGASVGYFQPPWRTNTNYGPLFGAFWGF